MQIKNKKPTAISLTDYQMLNSGSDEIVHAIEELICSPKLASALGRNGYKKILDKYDKK